jgi:outer membrane autotransporter protein
VVGSVPTDRCNPTQTGFGTGGMDGTGTGNSARGQGEGGPFGIWASGTIRSGNHDGRNGSADVDFETDGVSFGMDYRVNDGLVIGGGVGYGQDESDIGGNGSRSEGSALTLALYTSYSPGELFFLDALFGYQTLNYDLRRFVTSNGNFVRGSRDGTQWFGSVSVGADFRTGAWQFTPYLRGDVARGDLDAYTETGDTIFSLAYDKMAVDTNTGSAGLRIDYRRETSWGMLVPQFRVEYQHDFRADGAQVMRYADLPSGPFYSTSLSEFDRTRLILGAGVRFDFSTGWSLKFDYRGLIGSDDRDHGLQFNIDKKF